MKCFIPTRGYNRLKAHIVAETYGWEPHFVCDTGEQADRLKDKFGIKHRNIDVLYTPPDLGICTIAWVRDHIAKELMPRGEWCIWLDDNVRGVTCLPSPAHYAERLNFDDALSIDGQSTRWRDAFEHEATREDMLQLLDDTIMRAEQLGTIFCGFAIETNYFFRRLKWQLYGYVRTQFALYKNDGTTWYPDDFQSLMLEDMYKSVDVVCRYGSILINRYAKPIKTFFESGGIGSFEKRYPHLVENCSQLIRRYPGLLTYVKDHNYQVTFQKRSQKTVDEWRSAHGYL